MTDERGVIRKISWRDLFPWLILLRTFRIAIQPALLAVATAATLLTALGWLASRWIFLAKWDEENQKYVAEVPAGLGNSLADSVPPAVREYLPGAVTGIVEPFLALADPLRRLCHLNLTLGETAYYLFGSLVSLAVWALAGGFITRYAVLRLATEQEPDLAVTGRFSMGRYLWYFLTPLYPLVGILLIGIPIALLGIPIYFAPGFGSVLAGLFWIFVVVASLAAAWLLGGLLFGWPLMWPAVSAERDGDPFEAFSRSFAYVYGRPLHYFFYFVVAALFGALCFAVVQIAAALVTEFGFWALAWGGGGGNVTEIRTLVQEILDGRNETHADHPNQTLVFGSSLFALVVWFIGIVKAAFTYSFFWCVASAIYLLLRMDVDEKEIDEVFVEAPLARPATQPPAQKAPAPASAPTPTAAPTPAPPATMPISDD